jgi:hypothetical protein
MERKDPTAVEDLFATQALALNEVFSQYAGMAAGHFRDYRVLMNIALKAQSQCRWTLKALLAMSDARPITKVLSRRKVSRASDADAEPQKFFEQTIENGESPA